MSEKIKKNYFSYMNTKFIKNNNNVLKMCNSLRMYKNISNKINLKSSPFEYFC